MKRCTETGEKNKPVKKSSGSKWLNAAYAVVIAGKASLASGFYILANGLAEHDDMLAVRLAQSLLSGNWLGAYNNRTLVKGITFPVYLALNHVAGIPYAVSLTLLYGLACLLLCRSLRPVLKRDAFVFLSFLILFFNPVNGNSSSFLRVYRNSLSPVLLLLLLASFVELYYSENGRTWFRALWAGVCLALFVNNREDSFWILPFAIAAAGLSALRLVVRNRRNGKKTGFLLAAYILPFVVLLFVNTGIKSENNKQYGVPYRNELSEGGFPELMKALYSVGSEENIYRVSVPKSTVDRVCEVCPMFSELKPLLEENYGGGWDMHDGTTDGQIRDGWFFWCLRDCIYDRFPDLTPAEISEKCSLMAREIKTAQTFGQLPIRSGMVMPSALMSPYKGGYFRDLCSTFFKMLKASASFRRSDSFAHYKEGSLESIRMVEELTRSTADPGDGEFDGFQGSVYSFYEHLNRLYIECGSEMLLAACLCWCASLVLLLKRKSKDPLTGDALLFSFGFIASAMVFLLGVSYTDISAFDTCNVLYLSTVYPLFSAFCCVSIFNLINVINIKGNVNHESNRINSSDPLS